MRESSEHLRDVFGEDVETTVANQRYGFISGVLKRVVSRPVEERLYVSDHIDQIVTNRVLGLPLFLFFMWVMFKCTFTASKPFMHLIEAAQEWLAGAY